MKHNSATDLQCVDTEFLLEVCKIVLCTSGGVTYACLSECFYSKPDLNIYEELESSMKMLVCGQGD